MGYRRLNPDLLVKTQRRLTERITRRFPEAGLARVASELEVVARDAAERAEQIRRPAVPLRVGIALLIVAAVAVLIAVVTHLKVRSDLTDLSQLVPLVEAAIGTVVFLGAAVIFLFTLETRWKRTRALAAVHELRVLAHIVDMHQLTKHPEGILRGSPEEVHTTRTFYDLNRYLNYCIELLAILSKVASLYVQDFADAVAVEAVDDLETLCAELSNRVWQKLDVVERMQAEEQQARARADAEQRVGAPGLRPD